MDDSPDPPVAAPRLSTLPTRRARRGRPQGSGADELDQHRDGITRLRAGNMSLQDIMAHLSENFGVTARYVFPVIGEYIPEQKP